LPDLFLEFTNRQIRRFYGLYSLNERLHEEILGRWINVASWLAEEHGLVPIGFLTECRILRSVIARKRALFDAGFVQIPMRGASLNEFVVRRRDTYSPYAEDFTDLYDDEVAAFVESLRFAFKDRRSNSAESLVDRWHAGPDQSALWTPIKRLGTRAVNRLSKIPDILNRNEASVVWNGVSEMLEPQDRRYEDELQRILQTEYVEIYCTEYGVDTLRGLPYGWRDLRSSPTRQEALRYDNFVASLKPLGLRHLVERLSAASMVELRGRQGYLAFRDAYVRHCGATPPQLRPKIAAAADELREMGRQLTLAAIANAPEGFDVDLGNRQLESLDTILAIASVRMHSDRPARIVPPRRRAIETQLTTGTHMDSPGKRIAIFVALDEERNIFTRSTIDFNRNHHEDHLIGVKDGVTLEVYCAHGMGRVAAAVATMEYLEERGKPDLLLVTGLAGGFGQAKLERGALLVPEIVYDLAVRKITADDTLFTPSPYPLDERLVRYITSNLFDEPAWSAEAHHFAEWPQDLRPNIRHDPITSVDEVVTSVEHAEALRGHYRKLAAVEMEAGGVCAAAKSFGVPVAVIRCVSDKADPSKTDDIWRPRAMKTIISLLQSMDLARMLDFNAK
jgi:nucleoside phosphorylase